MKFTATYANPKKFCIIRLTPYLGIQGQYVVYTDGVATWRKGVRDTYFVLDKTLTLLGFNGDENIDWENVRQIGSMKLSFGLLYNWYAATDVRNIAPSGWHVPTPTEFNILTNYLGGMLVAGGKLKETGTTYWDTPNTGAINQYGFSGLGSGGRTNTGAFIEIKKRIRFWTSTVQSNYTLYYNYAYFISGISVVKNGCSIRLIKNDAVDPGTMTDYDGNIYPTIKIGTQVWMAVNLLVTHYNDGTLIPEVINNTTWAGLTTGALCVYNNDWNNV